MSSIDDNAICFIDANSDIAGIGVRAAVYIQALLAVIMSILYEGNKERSKKKRDHHPIRAIINSEFVKEADRTLEWTLFITGWALIISAMLMGLSNDSDTHLSDYHALVVLNLSSVNFWSGFDLLRRRALKVIAERKKVETTKLQWYHGFFVPYTIIRDPLSIVGTWLPFYVHSTLFSVFGIIFWMRQDLFKSNLECTVTPSVVYWAFGHIALSNKSLKSTSLSFYILSVFPVINAFFAELISTIIAIVLAVLCTILSAHILMAGVVIHSLTTFLGLVIQQALKPNQGGLGILVHFQGYTKRYVDYFDSINARLTTIVHTGPIIYWVIATEMLIRSNVNLINVDDENDWRSFGQVMPFLVACMSVGLYALQIIETRMKRKRGVLINLSAQDEEGQSGCLPSSASNSSSLSSSILHSGPIQMPEPRPYKPFPEPISYTQVLPPNSKIYPISRRNQSL